MKLNSYITTGLFENFEEAKFTYSQAISPETCAKTYADFFYRFLEEDKNEKVTVYVYHVDTQDIDKFEVYNKYPEFEQAVEAVDIQHSEFMTFLDLFIQAEQERSQ